jgi:hypothetical protein
MAKKYVNKCSKSLAIKDANPNDTEIRSHHSQAGYEELFVSQVPVAHTCNPSYSGGRDQED